MVEVIAEAGISYIGKLDAALRMADEAKWAGADAFKIQTFIPHKLFKTPPAGMDSLILSQPDTLRLVRHCEDIKIEFMSTPGELDSLKFLVEECNVKRIKIGSDDLTYRPLVEAAYKTGKPILLSTGMATLKEIEASLPHDGSFNSITLLHCMSMYPTPVEHANLNFIKQLKFLGYPVGYSDHTNVAVACYMAMAMGISIIEKHICPNGYAGVDAAVSMIPIEFRIFMANVHEYEKMLGPSLWENWGHPERPDRKNTKIFRKNEDGLRCP